MLALIVALALGSGSGDVERRVPAHRALMDAAAKQPKPYVPAPPVVNVVYESVDPSVNGGSEMVSAYTDAANNTIHLPKNPSPFMRSHETGHLFDSQVLSDGDRNYFQRIMHAPAGPWDHGQAYGKVEGNVSPNEWFADYYGAYAANLTGLNGQPSIGSFAMITPKRMKRFISALERLGHRNNLQPYRPSP